MVASSYQLPGAPQPAGRLIEASVALWLASWRACLPAALLYGLASLLPALTVSGLGAKLGNALLGLGFDQWLPWLPRGVGLDPSDLFDEARAWMSAPRTWIALSLALIGSLAALSLIIHRQLGIAQGLTRPWRAAMRDSMRRLPAGLGAWLIYCLILLLLTAPLGWLTWIVFRAVMSVDLLGLLAWLAIFLAGSALLSIPLGWASVAYGFAPFASAADDVGPLAAQGRSRRRVRGHWVHAAVVLSLPMLMYLGVASLFSSATLLLCGGAAYVSGGWVALFSGTWLVWSQALAFVPTAIGLPLATAGGVVAWHDLELRWRESCRSD